MELITVIVPIYKAEKFLLRCVSSIQNQTYKNLEIILVDDGSPDNCWELCQQFARQDSRIKIFHKENAGQGLARNDGLDMATGDYVTFIDSDDWISEDHIENLYSAIVENNADVALGNHTKVFANGETQTKMLSLKEGVYEGQSIVDEILLPLIGADTKNSKDILVNSSTSMNLYKMDVIRTNNIRYVSERYAVAEDFYFNVDFYHYSKRVVFTKECGYFYFQNFESTGEKYNPKRFERTLNYYSVICERVERYGLADRVGHRIGRSFLMKIRVAIRHITNSDMPRKEKLCRIEEILTNEVVHSVLLSYPIEDYNRSMRLLAKFMRAQRVRGVYRLMRSRENARNSKVLKKLLRKMGIGR
ncbi:MAG: glycosyltransferase [Clostridia bacterium]|nr:glycosyltransferase [Clostridia bacterium]